VTPRLGQWEDDDAWGGGASVEDAPPEAPPWEPPASSEPERPPPQDAPAWSGPVDRWWDAPDPGGWLDPVETALGDFLRISGGSVQGAQAAALQARSAGDSDVLRNAQHALVTQQALDDYGVAGAVMAVIAVPAYSAAKWVAQTVPGVGPLLDAVSPTPLTAAGGATPPSWSEVWWGLRPLWAPLR
jgi:hypothetical protein